MFSGIFFVKFLAGVFLGSHVRYPFTSQSHRSLVSRDIFFYQISDKKQSTFEAVARKNMKTCGYYLSCIFDVHTKNGMTAFLF